MADYNDQQTNSKQPRSRQGCQSCRSRRVKCDEERPRCRACVRLNVECIWTRHWTFRDESAMVAQAYNTVIDSRPNEASIVSDKPLRCTFNTMSTSVKNGRRNICFGKANRKNLVDHDLSPSNPQSVSTTTPSENDAFEIAMLYRRGLRLQPSVDTAHSDRDQALITAFSHCFPPDGTSFQSTSLQNWTTASFMGSQNQALFSRQSPALAAAVDTMSLIQAAVKLQDDRLAQQAVKRYAISVALLRESIPQISDREFNDIILAIFILQVTEGFYPVSQVGGWLTHVDGAAKIFQHRGPRQLGSSYETALFTHSRQHAILGGVLSRRQTFFSQPQWLAMSQSAPATNHLTRLLDIGSSVPGLLAETDKVLSNIRAEHFVYELLRKLDTTREAIVGWINEFWSSMDHEISVAIDIKEMEAYNEEMLGDSTFLPLFKFASYTTAWRILLGWTFHYTVLKATRDILTTRPDIVYKHQATELETDMLRVITKLCMAIPQLFAKQFGTSGRMAIVLPLTIVTEFYLSRGQAMELNWCQRVAKVAYSPREGVKPIWMPEWKEGLHVRARGS